LKRPKLQWRFWCYFTIRAKVRKKWWFWNCKWKYFILIKLVKKIFNFKKKESNKNDKKKKKISWFIVHFKVDFSIKNEGTDYA